MNETKTNPGDELKRAFEMPRVEAASASREPALPDIREVMQAVRGEVLGSDLAERVF